MHNLNICICGGGGLGTVCASVFSSFKNNVNLLTGHPENWSHNISIIDGRGKEYIGHLNKISDKPYEVIPTSDLILLCVPGYLIEKTIIEIKPYITNSSIIGSIVASTGFFFIAHKIIPPSVTLFGFQRVPFIARIKEYGKRAYILGYKDNLNVAIEGTSDPEYLRSILQILFQNKVNLLNNYLEASLTNSNPLLHTSRLYSMWNGKEKTAHDNISLFYRDWTNEASELLLQMDEEFMSLIEKLNLTKGAIKSILHHYEVNSAESLTRKIRMIPAFSTIQAPMVERNGKWYPDFSSRYFTEDFPYGLRFLKELTDRYKILNPNITKVYEWGINLLHNI